MAHTEKGHCCVWVEGAAGRGARDVGGCLNKHIEVNVTAKALLLWPDSCGGQSRTMKIVLLLTTVLGGHPTLERITLRNVLPGHSFLPNGSDFGDTACALQLQQRLYTVDDIMSAMNVCRPQSRKEGLRWNANAGKTNNKPQT